MTGTRLSINSIEVFAADRYRHLAVDFVQTNLSTSRRGVVRGLHFQRTAPQGKLVTVVRGAIFDVAVDLRRSSSTFGRHVAFTLDAAAGHQLYIPPGCAHGFQAVSVDDAVVLYALSAPYDPADERVVAWDDPDLSIAWPIHPVVTSVRDACVIFSTPTAIAASHRPDCTASTA